jgi:hypothetical protein
MSSESVCQVARSWVDVGSFHTRLFGVVYVTCGDLHDDSWPEAAAVSGETQNGCHPPPTIIPWYGTMWLLLISKNEIEAERTPVWYHWGDSGRIAESAYTLTEKGFQEALQKWRRRWDRCFMREGTTSRAMAADRPYGEFYDFYNVSPEHFGYHHVLLAL